MSVVRRTFKRSFKRFFERSKAYQAFYCGKTELCDIGFLDCLGDWFDLPWGAKVVSISMHDRPGRERLRCRVEKRLDNDEKRGWYPCLIMGLGDPIKEQGVNEQDSTLDLLLIKSGLVGKTFYMQVEYED